MNDGIERIEDLNQEDLARFALDLFHRMVIHYALWFTEIRHQMGMDRALDALETASHRSIAIQLKRLAPHFGFEMQGDLPGPLAAMPRDRLLALIDDAAVNWLANDGVWFQAVEFSAGMTDAKRCNDSCWAHFSPFEAWSIRKFLQIPVRAGLAGLKRALNFRVYARINRQSFIDEGPDSFIFRMDDCRVQAARRRKGLDDYPCKSGGIVEYTYFAKAIDTRITAECIACPPDSHPGEWFCAWRFKRE